MFVNRRKHKSSPEENEGGLKMEVLDPSQLQIKLTSHCGIPCKASKLAFDPAQRLLAVGTLDGKIKLLGNDGIEGLLVADLQVRCKFLEFAINQGHLINITAENDIQIWDLETQKLARTHRWHTNITAFAVIQGSPYMYVGEDSGDIAILQYNKEEDKLSQMPYGISLHAILGTFAGGYSHDNTPLVLDILPSPEIEHSRVLIAYSNGLIVLWGVHEAKILQVRGAGAIYPVAREGTHSSSDEESEEKDICCMCWADPYGSVLAVGYTDGDIMFWDYSPSISSTQSDKESPPSLIAAAPPLLKLQISTSTSRSPVLALQWCAASILGREGTGCSGVNGHLYVYGGGDSGCSDTVMVFWLISACGELNVTSARHVSLPLTESFDHMILIPRAGGTSNDPCSALFILTSSGHLQVYDEASITKCLEERSDFSPELAFVFKPFWTESSVTASRVTVLPKDMRVSDILSRFPRSFKGNMPQHLPGGTKWPINGGVLNNDLVEASRIQVMLITGHMDGSVSIWDASNSIICQLKGCISTRLCDPASVTQLEFCPVSGVLAVAQKNGVVCIYSLNTEASHVHCHFVDKVEGQDKIIPQEAGFQCIAIITVEDSGITSLAIAENLAHVGVGYANGAVLWFDANSGTKLFHSSVFSTPTRTPVVSVLFAPWPPAEIKPCDGIASSEATPPSDLMPQNIIYALSKDSSVVGVSLKGGKPLIFRPCHINHSSAAIALCYIDFKDEQVSVCPSTESSSELKGVRDKSNFEQSSDKLTDIDTSFLIVCTESSIYLYSCRSTSNQEGFPCLVKVSSSLSCCWASTFVSAPASAAGLALLDDSTGILQIRSVPNLKIVKEIPLEKFLKWSTKSSASPTIFSAEKGHVALVNTNEELVVFSFLSADYDSRNKASLVSFHDAEIAAAADAASKAGSHPVRRKSQIQELLGGVLKDLKGGVLKELKGGLMRTSRGVKDPVCTTSAPTNLSVIFATSPFMESSGSPQLDRTSEPDDPVSTVKDLEIDDIDILDDDKIAELPSDDLSQEKIHPSQEGKGKQAYGSDDRTSLLGGEKESTKPVRRSPEEIKAKYGHREVGEVSGAAGLARDKLLERQEKLQAIDKRSEEMQEGAKNFASMAAELAKTMEGRKWWQL